MKKILYSIIILSALAAGLTAFGASSCCNGNNACETCCSNGNCCNACDDDCCACTLGPCQGAPFLLPRSQGRNSARELAQWEQFINQNNKKDYSGAFYVALEYSETFKPEQISEFFFGSDVRSSCCSDTLIIQGSQVANRNPKAWLADYFGLSPAFESSVSFCPQIQNVILDLNWVINLDKWAKKLYVKLDMPIAWTQTHLGMSEVVKNDGSFPAVGFPAGYMDGIVTDGDTGVERNVLPDNFIQAMSGTTKFGDMQSPIKFGKMSTCKLQKAGIADLRGTLGYNFIVKEDGHFGIYGIVAAPTGNRPTAWYLLEPIIGNGKHWELGAGITSSYIFHRCASKSDDKYLGLYLDATISHLFKSHQCRSFDFNCKPNSRYMLLEQMGSNTDGIQANVNGTITPTTYEYQQNLIPAINWSTFCIDVSIGMQADIALKLTHVRENWNFDIGYNFWARTGEKFCNECCCDSCTTCTPDKQYAIKGDAFLYGARNVLFDNFGAIPLSATESTATIYGGTNYPVTPGNFACSNNSVDNAYPALTNSGQTLRCVGGIDPIKTSQPSILVAKNLLNMCKTPSAITNKIFLSINHAWKDANERYIPFLGFGSEVELASGFKHCGCNSCENNNTAATTNNTSSGCNNSGCSCNSGSGCSSNCGCEDDCGPSKRGGISQWGIWLKGGVQFD